MKRYSARSLQFRKLAGNRSDSPPLAQRVGFSDVPCEIGDNTGLLDTRQWLWVRPLQSVPALRIHLNHTKNEIVVHY
jgi:hypothetical protein